MDASLSLTMLVYTAEANSRSREALQLLASWAATIDREQQEQETPAQPRLTSL